MVLGFIVFGALLTGILATSAINPIFKDADGETAYVFEGDLIQISGGNTAFAEQQESSEIISPELAIDAK